MDQPLIVEILDQRGAVRSRTRLTTLPATIGRAYGSDVLLDDPYVCPRHAELTRDEDGAIVLRDAGSVNGLRTGPRGPRVASLPISSGTRVRIGQTDLRVVDVEHPVPPAIREADRTGFTEQLTVPRTALLVVAGAAAVFLLDGWLGDTSNDSITPILSDVLPIVLVLGMWAGAWALATRIVSHRFRLLAHWGWVSTIAAIGTVLSLLQGWVSFAAPTLDAAAGSAFIGVLVLTPLLIAGHLGIASGMTRGARWRAGFAVTAVIVLIAVVAETNGSEDTYSLDYPSELRPLPPALVSTVPLDRFMDIAGALQAQVDSLATEAPPEDETDEPAADSLGIQSPPDSATEGR